MKFNTEIRTSLRYINEDETQLFTEEDYVICCTKNKKRYIGKIVSIDEYQLEYDTTLETVIIIEMFDKSTKIVKVSDTTYLCKVPVNDFMNFPLIDERKDMDSFLNMFVALGMKKEGAEKVYETMREIANLYNIPFSTILSEVICKIGADNIRTEKDSLNVINQCMVIAVEAFQNTTDMLRKRIKNDFDVINTEK